MNQQTDTDATGPFAVGTGRSDPSPDFRSLQPNWIADGYGIRGPQRPVQQEPARPAAMDFGQPQNINPSPAGGPSTGAITVTTEDASGYTPGSGVGTVSNVTTLTFDQDMFEIFDGGGGQCVVRLKTCDATCGAT